MAAGAVDLKVSSVKIKSVFVVNAEPTETGSAGNGINRFAVLKNVYFAIIKIGGVNIPKKGIANLEALLQSNGFANTQLGFANLAFKDDLALSGKLGKNFTRGIAETAVFKLGFNVNLPKLLGFINKNGVYIMSITGDV